MPNWSYSKLINKLLLSKNEFLYGAALYTFFPKTLYKAPLKITKKTIKQLPTTFKSRKKWRSERKWLPQFIQHKDGFRSPNLYTSTNQMLQMLWVTESALNRPTCTTSIRPKQHKATKKSYPTETYPVHWECVQYTLLFFFGKPICKPGAFFEKRET